MSELMEAPHERLPEETTVLDPSGMQVRENDQGQLRLQLHDGATFDGVTLVPMFPVSRPHQFIILQENDGKEIGLLVDPRRLDRESREVVLHHADEAYFMPRILRIERIDEKPGMGIARWEVETDRGWNSFEMVSRSESVWHVGKNRVVIRDADGNRYLIADLSELDRRSRRLTDLYL